VKRETLQRYIDIMDVKYLNPKKSIAICYVEAKLHLIKGATCAM